ncbi:MAG: hypothetical protein WBX38_20410 [Candidatus Sulfotelmatobacter sp.]
MNCDQDGAGFLNSAVDGRATLLVSGDKTDLLAQGSVDGVQIGSAHESVEQMGY